jgi:crotonobetainyl-CoA:carnitine CoA-transferase CaiB-like acyl-CoA transferase
MESALYYNWPDLMINHTFEEGGVSLGELADLFEVYETSDGAVVIIIIAADEVFINFCSLFELNLHEHEKYSNLASRLIHRKELTDEINAVTRKYSTSDLVSIMDKAGISASICNQLEDVHQDPQVIDQGSIVTIDHPDLGKMRMPKPPVNFKGQGIFPRSLAPILGHDNKEVLSSIGVEDDTIRRMEEREQQNRELLAALMPTNQE